VTKRNDALSEEWYARPVLFVADIDRTLDFYVNQLGFTQSWRYEDNDKAFVAQVDRQGCALIFSSQWPDKVGRGLMFISLDVEAALNAVRAELADAALDARRAASVGMALDRLRAEFESRGVDVQNGWWGYRLLVVRDPDGNELYFNYPSNDEPPERA
jgi:catechol 2,3-dioxygenase-like lactoylglutathione lyase family enzyme